MFRSRLIRQVTNEIRALSPIDIKVAISIAVLTATLNALWIAYQVGYTDGQMGCGYPCRGSGHRDFTLEYMQYRIGIALAISAICLWSRKATGFFISGVALIYVCKEYLLWYLDSLRRLKELGLENFSQISVPSEIHHELNLYGAAWWNIIVLVIAIALFAWEIKTLITILHKITRQK